MCISMSYNKLTSHAVDEWNHICIYICVCIQNPLKKGQSRNVTALVSVRAATTTTKNNSKNTKESTFSFSFFFFFVSSIALHSFPLVDVGSSFCFVSNEK